MKKLSLLLLVLIWSVGSMVAQRTVSGTVTDSDDEPLIGANVIAKGTTVGAITDVDGQYQLTLPQGVETLIISYTGYQTRELTLGASNIADISLESDSEILDEVVVTALGFETKRSKLGNAQSTVDGDALRNSGDNRIINSLSGKAPGVNIVQSTGDPGAGSRIQIRGATSITGDLQPLIVLDGIPIFNDTYYGEGFGGNARGSGGSLGSGGGVTQQSRLNDLSPDEIEDVQVLRGASAAALWGSRAANGVIVITTKKGSSNGGKLDINFGTSVSFDQINQRVPLNETFGRGNGMLFQFTPSGGRSWGDKISERPGGTDEFITEGDAGYAGKFIANDGKTYYSIANGTQDNPNGGKNSTELFDIHDAIFKTGTTLDNSLSIGSSGQEGSIYFNFSTSHQDGIIKDNSTYERYNVRLNGTRKLGDKWTIQTNLGYVNSNSDRVQMGSNLNGLFLGGLRSAVDFDDSAYEGTYVDASGKTFIERQRGYRNPLGAGTVSIYDNPVWMMNNVLSDSKVNRLLGKAELRFEPLSWLNFTARGGVDTYSDEREDFFPVLAAGENNGGRFTKENITSSLYQFDLIGRARHDVNRNLAVTGLLGVGLTREQLDDAGATSRSFINPFSPPQLMNGSTIETFNYETEERTLGYYGTAGVEVGQQLYINLSGRFDYLSTLPESENGVFYPAVDVSWVADKYVKSDFVSALRLRGGWGQVGRGPNPYITSTDFYFPTGDNTGFGEGWGPGVNPAAYGGGAARSTVAGNPNIRPEIKTEWEAGFNARFLKKRLGLAFTYYANKIEDAILTVGAPESSGFVSIIDNVGEIENNGIEVEADLGLIQKKDFDLTIYGNFTRNRNEVTSLGGGTSELLSGFTGTSSRAIVGEQLGALWGAKWARDDAGALELDENGFPTIADNAGIIGDPNPDYRYGFGARAGWKGLSVDILFDASKGGDLWNGTRGALAFFGRAEYTTAETTLSQAQAESLIIYTGATVAESYPHRQNSDGSYTVRGEIKDFGGGEVFIEELYYRSGPGSGFTGPDEQFVEDASWFRLRELSLRYSLASANLNSEWLKNVSVYFTGRNLLLITDYSGVDPDTNLNGSGNNGFGLDYFQNPSTRSYKVGVNINF